MKIELNFYNLNLKVLYLCKDNYSIPLFKVIRNINPPDETIKLCIV